MKNGELSPNGELNQNERWWSSYPEENKTKAYSALLGLLTEKLGSEEEAGRLISRVHELYSFDVQAAFVACACNGITQAFDVLVSILEAPAPEKQNGDPQIISTTN